MRIIVVSDTHMHRMAKALPARLVKELQQADFIIHAGDWCDLSVADQLLKFAPVDGVAGNNDGVEIRRRFGLKKTITVSDKKIGIIHGHGGRGSAEQHALESFKGEEPDCLIYGHSHVPVLKEKNGMIVLNPGSPTDKRRQSLYSFAVVDIVDGDISAEHIFYPDKR
ncbi:metallophosphoesterase [Paenibacillus tarimensis]